MTYPNDPNFHPKYRHDVEQEVPVMASMTKTTWAGIGLVILLFGGLALWAYNSGDMQTAAVKQRPGVEQTVPPATTGQGGAASKMPAKDAR
jgi:hypothetical protein